MLATLIIWIYMLAVLYAWGRGGAALLRRLLRADREPELSLSLALLLGLVLVTVLAAAWSLVFPVGLAFNLLLAGWTLVFLLRSLRRKSLGIHLRGWHPLIAALGLAALVFVLNAATLQPSNPDTGLYHAQAVHWIESYPAVPGLGNLHGRLAYDSIWFVAVAAFSLRFLGGLSFHLASSVLFLITLLFCLEGVNALLQRRPSASALLKTALFPLATYLLAGDISSPGTDLPAALLVWISLALLVERGEKSGSPNRMVDALLVLFSIFAVTVKLLAAPLLLIPLGIIAVRLRRSETRLAAALAGLALLAAAPWLARNLILSGYPVYPGIALDVFHFDWRIPAESVRNETTSIRTFARLPHLPSGQVNAMTLREWVPLWFNNLTANQQRMFMAALESPALLLVSLLVEKLRIGNDRMRWGRLALPALLAWAGVLFWFFTAPAVRFGYGFLAATPVLALLPLLMPLAAWSLRRGRLAAVVAVLALILFQLGSLAQSAELRTLPARLVLPRDYAALPNEPCRLGNVTVWCPEQWQDCGYYAFPCTPNQRPSVMLRGKDLRDGFRSTQLVTLK